jgi:DNA-binding transcriptional LysR family regulator
MDVHLRDLRYFTVLAEHLHFTTAAQKLYISQPALSKQIRALERQLGFPLLERRPREVVLTPQGRALLPKARDMVAAWQQAWQQARAAGPTFSLTVGMQTAVGRDLQREALARFRDEGWRISLRLVSWEDPTAGLGDGGSDVAFLWLPLPAPGLVSRTLVRERRWVSLPVGHPLAARTEVDFADLADEPFVALPHAAGPVREFWLATDARDGREPLIGTEVTNPADTFEAIASGLGVALVAEGNTRLYQRPDVVHRPVRGLSPAELALVWRTNDTRPELAEFVAAFPELPPESARPRQGAGAA